MGEPGGAEEMPRRVRGEERERILALDPFALEGASPTDELPTTSEGPAASGGEPTDESGGSGNESPSPAGSTARPSSTSP